MTHIFLRPPKVSLVTTKSALVKRGRKRRETYLFISLRDGLPVIPKCRLRLPGVLDYPLVVVKIPMACRRQSEANVDGCDRHTLLSSSFAAGRSHLHWREVRE